jgi:ribosome-associated protein
MPLPVSPHLSIPDADIAESFVRASGPGGQYVNKVATAVELRFDIGRSSLPEDVKARLRTLAGQRVTTGGVLRIEAREHRTQAQNREAARARLVALVQRALAAPRRRRKTRPTAASRERRIASKIQRSRLKQARRDTDD